MTYEKQTWIDGVSPLNAERFNHMEDGIAKNAESLTNVSPTVSVTDITGGHRITITDKEGTKTVDVMDGSNGDPGDPGRGITSVQRTSGTGAAGTTDIYTITYSDSTTSTFTVYNGANGDDYTLTEADKTEIAQQAAALVDVDGVVKSTEQTFTDDEKAQVRTNIGAAATTDLLNYYTKSQTYTQEEIRTLVSAIPKFTISVVNVLPTTDISTTTVYLVKSGSDTDLYTEYIFIVDGNAPENGDSTYDETSGTWEILGSQRVDFTGYATEEWVNLRLAEFVTADKIVDLLGYTPAKESEIPTKVSQLENDSGYAKQTEVNQLSEAIDGKAAKLDASAYELPVLYLTGDISPIAVSKENKVTLTYTYGERSGTCTLKGQGATSYKKAQALINAGKAGKFNYTITFDDAFEAAEGWGAQKKYCLKANWIDSSHSRNVVSAKIWGRIVKSRTTANTVLNALPNGGAVDGFPCIIVHNGEFHGLYTFNIPKDGWMFGFAEDSTKTQAVVGANDHTTATQFKGEVAGDESDFETEFVSDETNTAWINTSLNRLINACVNSWGGDLDSVVGQYLDWDSAIDYYIFICVLRGSDMVDKNFLLTTFDGVKWFFTAYDMDSTYGLEWDGSKLNRPVTNIEFEACADISRVFELIKRYKTDALKARYKQLRKDILSESRICQIFENFAWAIPSSVAVWDVERYPTVPGSFVNGIDQICRWVRQRLERCDECINLLPAQETPVNPNPDTQTYTITNTLTNCTTSNNADTITEGTAYATTISANNGYTLDGATVSVTMGGEDITSTAYSNGVVTISSVTGNIVITVSAIEAASGYTNLVPTSIDTDGSIYNDVGYKDDVRLSSSGGVSGTAQSGSVTTGFIPFKNTDVIRMKGAEWLGAYTTYSGHWYVNLYDSNKSLVDGGAMPESSYTTNYATQISVEYDEATGVTTFQIIDPTGITGTYRLAAQQASYFRINAHGEGKDLIITVNEEITE